MKILSQKLNSKESKYFLEKLNKLKICTLQNKKPKRRPIKILHSNRYYFEEFSNKNYCLVARHDEETIEEKFNRLIYEIKNLTWEKDN